MKRVLAVLAVVVCVACALLPVTAFAAEGERVAAGDSTFEGSIMFASSELKIAGYANGLRSSYDASTIGGSDTLWNGYLQGECNSFPIQNIDVYSEFFSNINLFGTDCDNVFAVHYVFTFSESVSAADFGEYILCIPKEVSWAAIDYGVSVDGSEFYGENIAQTVRMYGTQRLNSLSKVDRQYSVDSALYDDVGYLPIYWFSELPQSGKTLDVVVYIDDGDVDVITSASAPSGLTGMLEYAFDIAMSGGGMVLDFLARLFRTELIAPLVSLTISGLMMALVIKFAG